MASRGVLTVRVSDAGLEQIDKLVESASQDGRTQSTRSDAVRALLAIGLANQDVKLAAVRRLRMRVEI